MAKIGRPPRLIAYDTDLNIKRRQRRQAAGLSGSCACARVLYAAIIALVGAIMLYTLATRGERGDQRHPRPQSDVRAAVRRRAAQRLHRAHPQQGAGDPQLRADGRGPDRHRPQGRRRHGDDRPHRRSSRSAPTRPTSCARWSAPIRPLPPAASIPLTFRITDREDRAAGDRRRPFPRTMRHADADRTSAPWSGRRPRGGDGADGAHLPGRLLRGRRRRQRHHDHAPRSRPSAASRPEAPIRPASPSRARSPRPRRRTRCTGRSRAKVSADARRNDRRTRRAPMQAAGRSPASRRSARLAHPTDRRADHVVPLDESAPGTFRGRTGAACRPLDPGHRAVARRQARVPLAATASSCT